MDVLRSRNYQKKKKKNLELKPIPLDKAIIRLKIKGINFILEPILMGIGNDKFQHLTNIQLNLDLGDQTLTIL